MDLLRRLDDLLAKAREAELRGDARLALSTLDAAEPPVRAFGTWHFARGALLFKTGEIEAAVQPLRQAAARLPEVAEAHANLAAALAERVRRQRAATGSRPTDADTVAGEARMLVEAEAAARRACVLRPGMPQPHVSLSDVLETAGRFEDALAVLDRLLESTPGYAPALSARATVLAQLGRREETRRPLDDRGQTGPAKEAMAETERAGGGERP